MRAGLVAGLRGHYAGRSVLTVARRLKALSLAFDNDPTQRSIGCSISTPVK
jgi:hypothetical protein